VLIVFGQSAMCQEQEYSIAEDKVPSIALDYVNSFSFAKKIKWYYETNGAEHSVEAKTKWKNHKYSIEFDTLGNLQDVEKTIVIKALKPNIRKGILNHLKDSFDHYKTYKVQKQYSGNQDDIREMILKNSPNDKVTINYEIVASIKKDGKRKLIEFLFDTDGNLVKTKRLYFSNTDNLEY
jgi:hypothetical protein